LREIRKTYLDLVRKTEKLSFGPDERLFYNGRGAISTVLDMGGSWEGFSSPQGGWSFVNRQAVVCSRRR